MAASSTSAVAARRRPAPATVRANIDFKNESIQVEGQMERGQKEAGLWIPPHRVEYAKNRRWCAINRLDPVRPLQRPARAQAGFAPSAAWPQRRREPGSTARGSRTCAFTTCVTPTPPRRLSRCGRLLPLAPARPRRCSAHAADLRGPLRGSREGSGIGEADSEPLLRSTTDGEGRNRTGDTTIFSRVLYQLSYLAAARRW